MAGSLTLANSERHRYATGSIMYFAQGIPQGLLAISIPVWLASQGVSEAGMFWTGAMRCPKCRADMEQVEYEGTEVDRCTICRGIWFDVGEIDILKTKQAAAAIDTGDKKTGRESNAVDCYDCPRCGGAMIRVVDPVQSHIWYETCSGCNGSYLDAGELSDLSTRSISDFFRSLTTPERK